MSERTQAAYDEWSLTYDEDPNPHLALEYEDVLALVAASPGEKILDAACGTGRYMGELIRAGAKVCGVDFSERMLAIARKRYPAVDFQAADLRHRLPFANSEFDCVVCAQALKHLQDLAPVMAEFARVLCPGGRLVFSVTHPDMNWDGYEMRVGPSLVLADRSDIFHHRFADYFASIDATGLEIDRIRQLPVSERIRHLLTDQSFQTVQGRFQIVVFKLAKPLLAAE